jgi:hypothetical protein
MHFNKKTYLKGMGWFLVLIGAFYLVLAIATYVGLFTWLMTSRELAIIGFFILFIAFSMLQIVVALEGREAETTTKK